MNIRSVLHILGWLALLLGLFLLIPLGIALFCGQGPTREVRAFLVAVLASVLIGLFFKRKFKFDSSGFGLCEGFATVTLSWVLLTLLGAIPFYLSGVCTSVVDAVFETMSGFSTTGATIFAKSDTLPDGIESLPSGILFWRSLTHWLGGMGIVALSIAVLPALGAGGNILFRAEVPGPTTDKLGPRIADTAKILWMIYTALTLGETLVLWILGMPLLDSFCHAFGTMATGGFSTKNVSIGFYGPAIQWVIIVFMFLAGVNFVLYFHLIRARFKPVYRNSEFRLYVGILVVAIAIIGLHLYFCPPERFAGPETYKDGAGYDVPGKAVRDAVFQSVAVMTTTGFCTEDFNAWPHVCRFLLIVLMVIGASAGSTGGGIKVVRLLIAFKTGFREIRRIIRPRAVFNVKIRQRTIPEEVIGNTAGFLILYFLLFGICSVFMHLLGLDLETAFSSVLACISNIGPGLGRVGAVENYAHIPAVGKIILAMCMLIGRLEIYAVLILFFPLAWKR